MRGGVGKCGDVWGEVYRCGEIWEGVGKIVDICVDKHIYQLYQIVDYNDYIKLVFRYIGDNVILVWCDFYYLGIE